MGVTQSVRPGLRVLILEGVDASDLRMRSEAIVVRAGHHIVDYPADADVVLQCGSLDAEMSAAADRIWDQVPFPKHRATVIDAQHLAGILTTAGADVANTAMQRRIATAEATGADDHQPEHHAPEHHPPEHHAGHDQPEHAHDEHAGHDQAAHGHDDHMSMGGPGGVPLASGSDDRDGLEMDVLHRRLGPFLPSWPAGLMVDVTLAGDTITEASVVASSSSPSGHGPAGGAAIELDGAAAILRLAGWDCAASRAMRIRDLALLDSHTEALRLVQPLVNSVRRSVLLRWSTRGLNARADASVRSVLLERLARAKNALQEHSVEPEPTTADTAIAQLIVGTDLGTARLLIAALSIRSESHTDATPVDHSMHHA